MSLNKWIMKKSSIGGSARTLIKAYIKTKEDEPNATRTEINEAVALWWFNLIGEEIKNRDLKKLRKSKTINKFITNIIILNRSEDLASSIGNLDVFYEVIDEICEEEIPNDYK